MFSFTFFRNPVTPVLRCLVYASVLSSVLTFAISMVSLGWLSVYMSPVACLLTWTYHIVVIFYDYKSFRYSTLSTYSLKPSQICGYLLAPIWLVDSIFGGLMAFSGPFCMTICPANAPDHPYPRPLIVLDALMTWTSCFLMYAVVIRATREKDKTFTHSQTLIGDDTSVAKVSFASQNSVEKSNETVSREDSPTLGVDSFNVHPLITKINYYNAHGEKVTLDCITGVMTNTSSK